jgi:predicted transcriptional regulator
MKEKCMKNNHHLTIRLPKQWDEYVRHIAEKTKTPYSHIYRSAIRAFIASKVEEAK